MKERKEKTKVIAFTNKQLSIHKLYKSVKTELEMQGYIFGEAKQKQKAPGKYGQEMEFEIKGFKAYDNFAKHELTIIMKFEKLRNKDGKTIGDGMILVESLVKMDYMNAWDKSKFTKWLFESLMFGILRYNDYKKKYMDPGLEMQAHIDRFIKEELELY